MLTEAVMVAVVTAGASILCQILISNKSAALMHYRLDALEGKVTKHNNLVERMAVAEQSLKSVHKRVDQIQEERV